MFPTSESLVRINIDRQLTACGWIAQDRATINLYASRGVAAREFPLETGGADYLLFVDRNVAEVVEAGLARASRLRQTVLWSACERRF